MRIRRPARRLHAMRRHPAVNELRRALVAACLLSSIAAACAGGSGFFKQYEYEEEMYLSLDGSATLYVNSSIAALNALRGTSFDTRESARVDRNGVRAFYTGPHTRVTRVTDSHRNGRRFVHVRIDVDDVRRLGASPPFAWSNYTLDEVGDRYVYRQTIGDAAGKDPGAVAWSGRELTAFRMHLPSKIEFHNTPTHTVGRGNILTWEQPLADRLKSVPLTLEVRMETQSILYRTLWLFGVTFVAVAVMFVLVIGWVLRRGKARDRLAGR